MSETGGNSGAAVTRALGLLGAALFLAAAAGCAPKVKFLDDPSGPIRRVIVLPLNDYCCEHHAVDYTFYGCIGGQGSGPAVASEVKKAIAAGERLELVPWGETVEAMRRVDFMIEDVARHIPDERICEIARELKADMVVRGEVYEYCASWTFFVPRSKLEFELRGVDTRSCDVLWRIRRRRRSWLRSNRTLVRRSVAPIVQEVAGQYVQGD